MNKVYIVLHKYDKDGEFGNAVTVTEPLFSVTNKKDAEDYVAKYSKTIVYAYAEPYQSLTQGLTCGTLKIQEVDLYESIDKVPKFKVTKTGYEDFKVNKEFSK